MLAHTFEDEEFDDADLDPNHPEFVTHTVAKETQQKYGMSPLLHPNYDFENFPFPFVDSPPPAGFLWVGFGRGPVPSTSDIFSPPTIQLVPLPEGFAAVVVDLSKQLKPQIEGMTARLMTVQTKKFGKIPSRRIRKDKLLLYLRVLDARAAGAKLKELADIAQLKTSESPEKSGLQVWDAACHLMFNWPT
jgi:hypothetical protein